MNRLVIGGVLALGVMAFTSCKRVRQGADLLDAVSCADGDKEACKKAFDANERRCEAGDAHTCILHGLEYENERVVPKDETRATALFERACTLGSADGCWYAASSHAQGRGVSEDPVRAVALAEKSCSGGSVNGCYELGTYAEYGRGMPKDTSKATSAYGRACALSKRSDGLGCSVAKRLAGIAK